MRCQKAIFGCYRVDQFADPEVFMNSLGAVFEGFPDEVIVYVSDPRTGIQRRSKWPPTISEVVEMCEEHREHLARLRQPKREVIPRLPSPRLQDMPDGYLARVLVQEGHPRYQSLVAWAETADRVYWKYDKSSDGWHGIMVPYNIWADGVRS